MRQATEQIARDLQSERKVNEALRQASEGGQNTDQVYQERYEEERARSREMDTQVSTLQR